MRLVWRYFRQRRGQFLWLVFVASVSAGFEALALVTLVPLATVAGTGGNYSGTLPGVQFSVTTSQLLAISSALVCGRMITQVYGGYLRARVIADYEARERMRVFDAYLQASWEKQAKERGGQLQDLMTTFVENATTAIDAFCASLVAFFSLLMMVLMALVIDSMVAVVIVAFLIVSFLVVRPLSKRTARYSREQSSLRQSLAHEVNQAVILTREVRVFDVAGAVRTGVRRLVQQGKRNRTVQSTLTISSAAAYQNVTLLMVVGGLGLIALLSFGGTAALAAIALLIVRALSYSQLFQGLYHRFVEVSPYSELIDQREAEFLATRQPPGDQVIPGVRRLEFVGVGYSYTHGTPALADVTFSSQRGQAVGIVGPSGAGKSTLLQMLLGLREPDTGEVLVDGVSLTDVAPSSWYRHVGFVPQEGMLLNGTVVENIAFFRQIPFEDVVRAAKLANIHDEILLWPDGYETMVGERGGAVSGGQRQRICIARALAFAPDVLVFDEPTSALDSASESLIHQTLEQLSGSVMLFVVAHSLATLRTCDRIMVLRSGRLEAFGPPDELADTNRYFKDALELARIRS